ncbi:hypothetical protein D3C73_812240 [compost metagenome]
MIDLPHHQHLHRIHGRRDIAQLKILARIESLPFDERAENDIRHIRTERNRHLLAPQIRKRAQSRLPRHHPQCPPGRYVKQPQRRTTVVQIGRHVGGHRNKIHLALHHQRTQLIGVGPQPELHRVRQFIQCATFEHVDQRVGNGRRRAGKGQVITLDLCQARGDRHREGRQKGDAVFELRERMEHQVGRSTLAQVSENGHTFRV